MKARTMIGIAAVAAATALAGLGAPESEAAAPNGKGHTRCGTHMINGKRWEVLAANLECGTAVGVVRRVARMKVRGLVGTPSSLYPGTFSGMSGMGNREAARPHVDLVRAEGAVAPRRLVLPQGSHAPGVSAPIADPAGPRAF